MRKHQTSGRSPHSRPQKSLRIESLEARTLLTTTPASTVLDLSGITVKREQFDLDHILVRYKTGQSPVALGSSSVGASVSGVSGLYKILLGSGLTVDRALSLYRGDARVAMAEPDYELTSSVVSNDPRFSEQWSHKNTGQSSGKVGSDLGTNLAWDVTTGSMKTVVSVMDSGVDYTHPDLYLNIWVNQGEIPASRKANLRDIDADGLITFRDLNDSRNQGAGKITDLNRNGHIDPSDLLTRMTKDGSGKDTGQGGWANGVSDNGDGFVDDINGWNFVGNNNNPMDDLGHGTHVAGTIGAVGNNSVGVTGINWQVQLMPIKFISSNGNGSVSNFIEGLNYAVTLGAKISNNSWTGAGESSLLSTAIQNARAKGHIFVAAAGNYSNDNDVAPTYPAGFHFDNVVSVAASDRQDRLAGFSNYGDQSVDLAAPGVDILSTTLGGGYGYNSGTSMATPHVTGAMALVWSAHPEWTYRQVIQQILTSVEKVSTLAGKTITGGRLDASAALATPAVAQTPLLITSGVSSGPAAYSLNKIRVTFNQTVALWSFTPADIVLTGPNGKVIPVSSVTVVAGTNNKVFDLNFATQSTAGAYSIKIGPYVMTSNNVQLKLWTATYQVASQPAALQISNAVASGPSSASITQVRVTFNRAVALSSFTTADVRFINPAGQSVRIALVKVVSGTGDRTFDITFASQTAAGNYTLQIGREVTDVSGNKMNLFTKTFKIVEAPAQVQTYQSTVDSAITPNGRAVSMLSIRDTGSVLDLNVVLNITHPRLADLYIHLQAPDGTNIILANRNGSTSANMVNTIFDDSGSLHVALGRGPYTGSYQPIVPLSNLVGKNVQGIWKMWVEDRGGVNRGTLNDWSLVIKKR